MADVAEVEIKSGTTLVDLAPGECFITVYDYKQVGTKAQVWMRIETRHFNPNDEKNPKTGFMTINLSTGINGGHTLTAPVYRVRVEIKPTIHVDYGATRP
jgi:hypothetical protein